MNSTQFVHLLEMYSPKFYANGVHDIKDLEVTGLRHPVDIFKILEKAPLWG